ncbi:MAG: acyl-CoA/acyl-ACP dehydrogenase [Actinobacteria bacterium]|nr:acyl-CoA/acyl-ACP dehydrogenase [Actinomycetota bacterium]
MTDAVATANRLADRFAQRAAAFDADAAFPTADIDDLRDSGLLGLMVPQEFGGHGAGFLDYCRVAQTLARGAPATALLFNMHASVTGSLAGIPEDLARAMGATDGFFEHRARVLEAAAQGSMYGVAITERGAGSRLSKLQTTYRPDRDGYRIVGHKSVCSGAGHLDAYLVAARAVDGTDERGQPLVSHFLVPDGEGLDVDDAWDPHGMRATASNGFTLDMHVQADALLGGVEGLALPLAHLMPQWLVASYAAVYVGVARAVLDEACAYLQRRTVAGQPAGLTRLAAVRARIGRADADTEAARLVLEDAARRIDAAPGDPDTNRAIYRAKLLAGDVAVDVAGSVVEACGLGSLTRGSVLERLLRDARSGPLMPPSSDVAADVLGTAALGLDPHEGTDIHPW